MFTLILYEESGLLTRVSAREFKLLSDKKRMKRMKTVYVNYEIPSKETARTIAVPKGEGGEKGVESFL